MLEIPINFAYDSPLHTPDVIAGMSNQAFQELKEKCQGHFVLSWRGGAVYLVSKSDDKNGKPVWTYPPRGSGTHNYAKFETAMRQAAKKIRGLFDLETAEDSEHRYRIWMIRVTAFATLATQQLPKGVTFANRKGGPVPKVAKRVDKVRANAGKQAKGKAPRHNR